MAGNFIAMVYAVLRDKGVDTKGIEPDEAVAKYEELTGKTGRYSTKTGELEEDNKSKIIVPKASGVNRSNTKSHLSHAKEMGLNEKQYIKAAEEFFITMAMAKSSFHISADGFINMIAFPRLVLLQVKMDASILFLRLNQETLIE